MTLSVNKKAGFTLIEMVVSLSIIVMITVIFTSNYQFNNKRTDLIMTAQGLASDLHLAQNNTLGLVKYNGLVPAGGWGIHLDMASSTYTLFADLDAPGGPGYLNYDSGEGDQNYGARLVSLPDGITISNLSVNGVSVNSPVNVTFLPPDPKTNIYVVNSAATSSDLTIQLTEKRTNSVKTLRVNFLGLVEVTD